MANLLSWSGGLSLQKKKNENQLSGGSTISSLRNPFQIAQTINNQIRANKVNGFQSSNNTGSSTSNNSFQQQNFQQQNDFQAQQAEQQRRQQEEQRRQQIERMRQEQEQRQQQEREKQLQQQQAQQQKQQQLLNSSLNGGNLQTNRIFGDRKSALQNTSNTDFTTFRNNLEAKKQERIQAELQQNPWKKYYEEEKRKVRDQAFKNDWGGSTLQDIFNAGWDRRLAETNAKNRYTNELLNQGQIDKAKEAAKDASNTARQYSEQERATGRSLGATYDSDYKDNRILATFNAIRNMDVGNAMLGGSEGGGSDAAKFVLNLLPGMLSAPDQGVINLSESIAGKGLDKNTGNLKELTTQERVGRGVSGGIDMAGVFFGGSKNLLDSVGKALFNKGAEEVTKQAVKNTTKDVIKGYVKAMLEEGTEEGVQQAFEFFGDGGRLVTKDGEFDADSFKDLVGQVAQSSMLGATGGGIFHAGGRAIDATHNAITNKKSTNSDAIGSNLNNNLIQNATNVAQNTDIDTRSDTNVPNTSTDEDVSIDPTKVQTTPDGSMVKQNPDGTNTKLSDAELASVISQESPQANAVSGINPFQNNSFSLKSSDEDINTLFKRAERGDIYARQRLAELTKQNQDENVDWHGKSVDEVINPENEMNILQGDNTQNKAILNNQQQINQKQAENVVQNASNELNGRSFDELTPTEQAEWFETHKDQIMSETQLAQALRQMNIDPIGMSRLDMLREYSKALKNTTPGISTESEIGNAPEILPSERSINQDQEAAAYLSKDLAPEPTTSTRTDTTGAGEGTTDASNRIPTIEELSVISPEQQRDGWVRQPSKNSIEVANIQETLVNDGSNMRKFTTVLRGVSNRVADVVKKAIGLDVRNYDHTVDNYAMIHAIKDHGNDLIPVKMSDYEKIPEIIKTADNVYWDSGETNAGKNKKGQPKNRNGVIVYEKNYGDRVVYLEEVRKGRRELAMKTMYWQDAQKNSTTDSANPHLMSDTDSLRALSRRREGANDVIVSQNGENVNAKSGRSYGAETEGLPTDFDVKHYVSEQVEAQKKRSKSPLKERISDVTAELKHYLVDDAVAYERYIKDKNERLNIREGVDRVRSSDMIASQYMKDHGLEELGKLSETDMNEFQQYLIAKRALEMEKQGKATGRSKAADEALIKSVGNKYAEEEAIVRQYTRDMLEYSAENGLISKKLKDDLIRNNPNYVPMNRVFDVIENKTGFKSKQLGNLSKQTVVQKMTGSERTVENPIESLMINTMRMVNEVERNKTARLIADSKAFHEKVLAEDEKPRPGYDKLSYMVNGEKVSYEVPELVAKEMKNLNNVLPKSAENILNIVGAPTKWLRAGATQNNPIFAASNLLRDQMQTVVTGKVSANLKGTKDAMIATFSPTKKGKELRAELNRAGIIGNEYRQTYGYESGEMVKQLQNSANLKKRAAERAKHPINALADLIGKTEYFTRAQQYFGTDGDATTKAQAARNNTLNFSRAGATTRILNRIIPFLNAGVQGGRITINSFKNRPIHSTIAVASLTGLALAAKGAAEAQDKELWDRIDDADKGQNIIIFTPDAHYDSDTNRVEGIIKIPVAQMLYPMMDAANNLKGDASDITTLAGDIFTATTGLEAPNEEKGLLPVVNQLTPTAVKPFLEAAMNKSSYTGNDLVSEYDNNKAPEDKGAKYTSGLARSIASATGVDAPIVDNFIQNWGGGLAKDLSKVMTDNPDNPKDGGGVGKMFENGFNRRFLSGTVQSQYEIAEGLAKNYKNEVKNSDAFKNLNSDQQQKVLNAIDNDMKGIASVSTKVEQDKANDKTSLTKRQTEIVANGFNANNYINAITDEKAAYSGGGDKSAGRTLTGNVLDYGKTGARNNTIKANSSIPNGSKSIFEKYNSMSKEDWNNYLYGSSAESAAAEYNLAKAKYENSLANNELNDAQKVKKEKELRKLNVSKDWEKKYRDAYSLAGSKSDMQEFLNDLDDQTRAETVGILNGLNRAMYEAGVIQASTYKSRSNAINGTTTAKSSGRRKKSSGGKSSKSSSGMSSAEASALSSLAKTMVKNNSSNKASTPKAPETKRKMTKTKSSSNKTGLRSYSTNLAKKATVTKGAKRSIA